MTQSDRPISAEVSALLAAELRDMGRGGQLVSSALLPHGVVTIVYELEPLEVTSGMKQLREIRWATSVADRGRSSGIVKTEWEGVG